MPDTGRGPKGIQVATAGVSLLTSSITTGNPSGGWVELVASMPASSDYMIIHITGGGYQRHSMSIAVGAAGFEVPICEDIIFAAHNGVQTGLFINIAKGQRVSFQYWAEAATSAGIAMNFFSGAMHRKPNFNPASYGDGVGHYDGLHVSSADGFKEFVASSGEHSWFFISVNHNDVTLTDVLQTFELAIGAAGFETVIAPKIQVLGNTNESMSVDSSINPVRIPKGSRISVRKTGGQQSYLKIIAG